MLDQIQKGIVESLPPKPHGRLHLAPRVGKTKIVVEIALRNKPKSILWVTPSRYLADEIVPAECQKWGLNTETLFTTTYSSLKKISGHYEMIVLDEEQAITELNSTPLLEGVLTYDYIISMTGTPTKDYDKIKIYDRLKLKVLKSVDINEAVDKEILSNYEVKVWHLEPNESTKVKAGSKNNPFITTEAKNLRYLENKCKLNPGSMMEMIRLRAISTSPTKEEFTRKLISKLKGRVIVFCGSIEQAKRVSPFGNYHSKTDDKDMLLFQNKQIELISMVNSGGIGYTYKDIDHLIVVQANSDINGNTSQKISRALLKQGDRVAVIHVICLDNTRDETWVERALLNFDRTKIRHINGSI